MGKIYLEKIRGSSRYLSIYENHDKKFQREKKTTSVRPIDLIHAFVISALRKGRLTTTNPVLSIDVARRGWNEATRGARWPRRSSGHAQLQLCPRSLCEDYGVQWTRRRGFERDRIVHHRKVVLGTANAWKLNLKRVQRIVPCTFHLTPRSRYGQTCTNVRQTRCKTLLWGIKSERVRQGGGREGGREGRGEGDGEGCRCAVGGRFRGLTRAAGVMSALPSALRLTCCCCCCWLLLICLVVFLIPAPCTSDTPRQVVRRIRERPGGDDDAFVHGSSYLDDTDVAYDDEDDDDDFENWLDKNITAGKCIIDLYSIRQWQCSR